MNSRNCERLNGFHVILRGYLAMAADLAGDQWNEGDVSCSVVWRVMLPDAFFAMDGLLETFLTILGQMELNTTVIARETRHYLPFLLTTTFRMEAVRAGVGREAAHELVKEHAVAAARELRNGKTGCHAGNWTPSSTPLVRRRAWLVRRRTLLWRGLGSGWRGSPMLWR
ncbi:MAG: hypothetical protein LBD01_05905 [Puniceicoccales bacterium]|jgi:adenylosuccinate lyase|nr:hypothetical protein [Puniceicoccales bacterium]